MKHKFGITLEQYNEMLVKQDFRCAVCNKHVSKLKKALDVDHNHETGEIRGLLCMNCNIGLGMFSDNIDNLEEAIEYLKS